MSTLHVADKRPAEFPGDPILAAQRTYRSLLRALATPGIVHRLNVHPAIAQTEFVGNPWLASALLTLLDHEVTLAVAPVPAGDALAEFLYRRTRTPVVSLDRADFVVAALASLDPDSLQQVKRGSLHYPDDAATLFLHVDSLAPTSNPAARLTVRGPGVDESHEIFLPEVSDAFLAARELVNRHYPLGIDVFLIDNAGQVIGLPRTSELSRPRGGV